jgi:hypothetical protein
MAVLAVTDLKVMASVYTKMRNTYKNSLRKTLRMKDLGKQRRRRQDNIKMHFE